MIVAYGFNQGGITIIIQRININAIAPNNSPTMSMLPSSAAICNGFERSHLFDLRPPPFR